MAETEPLSFFCEIGWAFRTHVSCSSIDPAQQFAHLEQSFFIFSLNFTFKNFSFLWPWKRGRQPLVLATMWFAIYSIYADQQSFLISSQWALLSAKNAERQFVKHKWKARGWGKAAEVRVTLDTSAHAWDDIHSVAKKVDALLHTIPVTRENVS